MDGDGLWVAGDNFLRELILTSHDVSRCLASLSKLARHLAEPVALTGSIAAGSHLLNQRRRSLKKRLNDMGIVAL